MGTATPPPLPPLGSAVRRGIGPNAPRIRRQNGKAIYWTLGIFLALLMLAAGMGIFGFATNELGTGKTIAAGLLASLPIPIFAGLILWLDRIEGEPPLLVLAAFTWGATVAVFIAYLTNTIFSAVVAVGTGNDGIGQVGGIVISAPLVEEIAKGSFLLLFLFAKREMNGPLDGLVYGGMTGLGFAMSENIFYYGRAMQEGWGAAGALFVLRGLMFALSHPLFTTLTGIGVAMSIKARSGFASFLWIAGGLSCAILAHFCWNYIAVFGEANAIWILEALLVVGVGFILIVVGITLFLEWQVLRKHLVMYRDSGTMNKETYGWAVSLRRRLIPGAWLRYPPQLRPSLRRMMRVSAELAFSHERAATSEGLRLQEEIAFQEDLAEELYILAARLQDRGAGV